MRITPVLLSLALAGCGDKEGDDTSTATTEIDPDVWPFAVAELAELSSSECPDMSATGTTSSFLSSGEERTVTMLFPEVTNEDTKVVFFFHGLMDSSHGSPSTVFATSLGLQDMADDQNAIVVLPESNLWSMLGFEFFLWDVEDGTYDNDVTLYDDLRTCVYEEFAPNLDKVFSMGFSGGGLFTTVITSQRGDTLAGAIEMSGGADIDTGFLDGLVAPYATPAAPVPVFLTSGGSSDVWPSPKLVVVDFEAGTETMAANLAADGHFVIRCSHNNGHTVTNADFNAALDWISVHEYGQPSPYETEGIGDWSSWCEVAQ